MKKGQLSRRRFISTVSAVSASLPFLSPSKLFASNANSLKRATTPLAIASANGLAATELAVKQMMDGVDPLDAAIAGVTLVENDPDDMSVGLGGLPNEDGDVELDAAVMHGPTHRAGGVASIRNIKNPASVAKLVLEQTDHVLIVGDGALRFARAHGFKEEDLLTDKSRKVWLYWKQKMSDADDWIPPDPSEVDEDVRSIVDRITGTIHLSAINTKGDMSCVTTTSGLAFKIPGRVGDSPIIGAGLYVDNDFGSCGSTGRGEANLQNLCSHLGVELMRQGKSPLDAGLEVLRRVIEKTSEKRLLNSEGNPNFGLKFYLVDKSGSYAGVSMWGPSKFAVADHNGARLEEAEFLYEYR